MLAPTLAIALTWLVAAIVLLGCGYLCRQALLSVLGFAAQRELRPADLWIGLAALVAYLEVWSLFAPITSTTLIAPGVAAALSGARFRWVGVRGLAHRVSPKVIAVGAVSALGVLWLGNQSLGRPTSYDSGLYHFAAVEYASRFAAIPGVGNLHERLGAADSHLLLVALLGSGPWRSAGFHLANGLLAVMLLADVGWRLAERRTPAFTRRAAVLVVPATLAVLTIDPGTRLRSPSLDFPGVHPRCYRARCISARPSSSLMWERQSRPTAAFSDSVCDTSALPPCDDRHRLHLRSRLATLARAFLPS